MPDTSFRPDSCRAHTTEDSADANQERGVVLILVALLGMVLLMFVAYAIDLSMFANSREAAGQYSRLAALSAIEGYFSAQKDVDAHPEWTDAEKETEKLKSALLRANEITLSNKVIDAKTALRANSAHAIVLYDKDNPEPNKPVLTPGRWYFRLPTGSTADDIGCTPPCFAELKAGQTSNAMKISGTLYTSTLSNIARSAFGTKELPAKVSAVASVVPRHGCFLVDLSPSVTANTHLPRLEWNQVHESGNGHGRVFGFYLGRDNNGADAGDHYQDAVLAQNAGCAGNGSGTYFWHNCWYNLLEQFFPARVGDTDPTKHFANDYLKKKLLGDSSFGDNPAYAQHHPNPNLQPRFKTADEGPWVRVDAFRDADYEGPKPLQTILAGLRAAIDGFKKRAVAGDMLCLIFYDRSLSWQRTVALTDDFDYLMRFTSTNWTNPPAADADDIYSNPLKRPSLATNAPGFETIVRHGIFPANNGFTDMTLAVSEATAQLSAGAQKGVPSSDFVVLIGDGLTNCTMADNLCGNVYSRYKAAMAELQDYINQHYVPAEIPVHVILAGDHVAPHTVIRKRPDSNECYTSAEARKENLPYVFGGDADGLPFASEAAADEAFDKASASTPFFQANADMYAIAAATKGLWAPLRASTNCTPLLDCSAIATPVRWTDDPQCRTVDQQMDAYIDDILGLNPYALVSLE